VTDTEPVEIRGGVLLPADRRDVELRTSDGLTLVGELSLPLDRDPVATIVALHPLPTAGGFMDSHVVRKMAARLPALAGVAVLRFNFRGVSSPRGTSEGSFGEGVAEAADLEAALRLVADEGLPTPWLVGWSFGTEVALKHGLGHDLAGVVLLSPPLHRYGRRARPVGGRRRPAHGPRARAGRLPAARRGPPTLRPRARGRPRGRRGSQAPLGGREADHPGARRDRAARGAGGAPAADHVARARRSRLTRDSCDAAARTTSGDGDLSGCSAGGRRPRGGR